MKVTFSMDDGTELTVKGESLRLVNGENQPVVAVVHMMGGAAVPLLTFNGQLATPEEIAARTKKPSVSEEVKELEKVQ